MQRFIPALTHSEAVGPAAGRADRLRYCLIWLALAALLLGGPRLAAQTATAVPSPSSLSVGGGTVTLTLTVTLPASALSSLGWTVDLPGGWSYVSTAGTNVPGVRPSTGDTSQLGWAYTDAGSLSGSVQFITTLAYAAGLSGEQRIKSRATYRLVSVPNVSTDVAAPDVVFSLPASAITITAQPVSLSVVAGLSASFSVTASGPSPLSYQWRKNGVALSGATSSTLTLATVSAADTAAYDVVVSGGGASVTSSSAALTVNPVQSPPVITQQPASVAATSGGTATFSVNASGTPTPTYQWRRNSAAIAGATNAALLLSNLQTDHAGTYDVVVTNSAGSVTSTAVTLAVTSGTGAPAISSQPSGTTVANGGAASFSVVATGTPAPTYQWRKDGTDLAGATNATLTLTNVQRTNAGTYNVVVRNTVGSVTSSAAVLTVVTASSPPTISTQPVAQSVNVGASVSFSVVVTGEPSPTYQWRKAGVAIAGATNPTLTITSAQPADAGSYDVVVSWDVVIANSVGRTTSNAATLTVTTVPTTASRLINASVRCSAGSGDQTLIVGFILRGTGARQLLLRGIGPTLADFGVTGALADPRLRLFNADGAVVTENDDWGGLLSLSTAFAQAGAFALPAASKDAALLIPLAPGNYTAHVTSVGASGVALVEAYDADAGPATARLANLSVRTQVGSGDNVLVVGFVISGSVAKDLLVRGIGPGLAPFGVTGTLADPQLRLFDSQGRVVQQNDDWGGTTALTALFAQTAAFALPANSKDAALSARLAPGSYTVEVSGLPAGAGVAGATGVALVELYELP
ncbi:MAG: immunoglobulin domain-containing protein [Verrucomicrobia bacterium]|nr:immunoglobulin domain-containing protein [Verrucomicrobiota bacterium]